MAKFSLPSLSAIKLPFGKGGDSSLYDPIDEDEFDDDTDEEEHEFGYVPPSKFQKMVPWLMVLAGYLITVGGVTGTYVYLDSNAEKIEQELIDQRPTNLVEQIKIAETRTLKKPEPEAKPEPEVKAEIKVPEVKEPEASHAEVPQTEALNPDKTPDKKVDGHEKEAAEAEVEAPAQPATAVSLLPHPDMSLTEVTADGLLPVIGEDGREPWRVYARPYNSFETKSKIAIVITGLGISEEMTEEAISLPGEVTLAFAPFSTKINEWIEKARNAGHEVMITLPMEPTDFPKSDPGPYALYSSLDSAQNIDKLNWILSRATGYVGLISYQGSKFLSADAKVRSLASQLKTRGLLYMDSFYSPVNAAPKMMRISEVPYISPYMTLDKIPGRVNVSKSLKEVEKEAMAKGVAVAIAHPYKTSLKRIKVWSKDLAEKNLALVPVSSVVIEGLQN